MAKEAGLTCKIWNETQLAQGGFGGILGVGQGLGQPAAHDRAHLPGRGRQAAPIALTGKGIAFDSGGLSLKDAAGMETMKCDMGGAASILATMKAIARLKAEGQRDRGDPVQREHAERLGAEARRRDHAPRRDDLGGAQHRRRGPAGAGRRARVPRGAATRV